MRPTIERIVRVQPAFLQTKFAAALLCGALLGSVPPAQAQFTQQGPKLVGTFASGPVPQQGFSVALSEDGNTAIVGGPGDGFFGVGAAWVFRRNGSMWIQQGKKLVDQGAPSLTAFGSSVAISRHGTIAIVGGPADHNNFGAAWMFARSSSGVWVQRGNKLVGTSGVGSPQQGTSVALSGDGTTAIVGGPDDNIVGAAWVFTYSGGVWTQQGNKLADTTAAGNPGQGTSVALSEDGNTALIGGPGDNNGVGATWVFTRSAGVWTKAAKLVGSGAAGPSGQGSSVALSADGKTAIVGGPLDNGQFGGAVWMFACVTRSAFLGGCTWHQQGSKLVGSLNFGAAVALSGDGNTAIVGASGIRLGSAVGSASVFARNGGIWTQLGTPLVGTGAVGDSFQGSSVAISSCNVALVGGVGDKNFFGAVWVFERKPIC